MKNTDYYSQQRNKFKKARRAEEETPFSRSIDKPLPKDFTKCPWCKQKIHLVQTKEGKCPNCRGQLG